MPVKPLKDTTLDKPALNVFEDLNKIRNRQDTNVHFLTDADTSLRDFYWQYDRSIAPYDSVYKYKPAPVVYEVLSDSVQKSYAGKYLYELSFTNKGGLVMPVIVEFIFNDGIRDTVRIPAQIWRKNELHFSKVFLTDKQVAAINLDPVRETADIDLSNNSWPSVAAPGKFAVFKQKQTVARGQSASESPMQHAEKK